MVNETVAKEEIKENKKSKKKTIPKEISQEILKKMFESLLKAVGIMFYFIILNLAYSTMKQERLIDDIKVFASTFLVVGIVFLERAYKKDNGSLALNGIEFLVLSLHSLSIMHVITLFQYDFRFYLLTSSYIFSIYYVLKATVLYTKGRKEYLNSLSDISEIVKKDEPVKKEAKKREVGEEVKKANHTKKTETKMKDSSKTREENKIVKKKTTSKTKSEVVKKAEEKEVPDTKKKTTKSKVKTLKEKNAKEDQIVKKTESKSKGVKENRTSKVETEKNETTEKKKRGRPKKEVTKND